MASKFRKFPRLTFNVKDAEGVAVGQIVAKNEYEAKERADATYPQATGPLTVEQFTHEQAEADTAAGTAGSTQ